MYTYIYIYSFYVTTDFLCTAIYSPVCQISALRHFVVFHLKLYTHTGNTHTNTHAFVHAWQCLELKPKLNTDILSTS